MRVPFIAASILLLVVAPGSAAGGSFIAQASPLADLQPVTAPQSVPHASAIPAGSPLDQSWMHPGFTVDYLGNPLNAGASGTPLDWFQSEYRITDRNDASEVVSFHLSASTLETITDASFSVNLTTREEVSAPGHYTPLWINQTNVDTGGAWIGNEYAAMTPLSNPAFYEFSTASRDFFYDRATGFLIGLTDEGTGFAVQTCHAG